MKLQLKHHVSRETYCESYRFYHRQRFHSSQLLLVCVSLYFIEILIKLYAGENVNFTMNLTLIIIIISTIIQFVNEYIFPKIEYRNLEENGLTDTTVTITDDYIMYGIGMDSDSNNWNEYIKCIETPNSFLLLKKTSFSLLMKTEFDEDMVLLRRIIVEKVNKGKPLKFKK